MLRRKVSQSGKKEQIQSWDNVNVCSPWEKGPVIPASAVPTSTTIASTTSSPGITITGTATATSPARTNIRGCRESQEMIEYPPPEHRFRETRTVRRHCPGRTCWEGVRVRGGAPKPAHLNRNPGRTRRVDAAFCGKSRKPGYGEVMAGEASSARRHSFTAGLLGIPRWRDGF